MDRDMDYKDDSQKRWGGPQVAEQSQAGSLGGALMKSRADPTGDTQSPVRDSITRIEETIQKLLQLSENLEQRLDLILSHVPSASQPSVNSQVERGPSCSLHSRLNQLHEGLRTLGDKLSGIHQRIQL